MAYLLAALAAYLIGAIPTGFLVGRARGIDLRKVGSGNIGATNAARTLGKGWGYFCFAADFLKGFIPAFVARTWWASTFDANPEWCGLIAAACAVLGHNFPVWLGFKGGKGISTSGGIILGLFQPIVFVTAVSTWLILFLTTRIVSVASLGGALALPISLAVLTAHGQSPVMYLVLGIVLAALAVWRHRSNILRLVSGTEPKFHRGKPQTDSTPPKQTDV